MLKESVNFMVKKIILNSNKYYYTYLDDVFQGLGDSMKEYNWLIADYECNYYPNDFFKKIDIIIYGYQVKNYLI